MLILSCKSISSQYYVYTYCGKYLLTKNDFRGLIMMINMARRNSQHNVRQQNSYKIKNIRFNINISYVIISVAFGSNLVKVSISVFKHQMP